LTTDSLGDITSVSATDAATSAAVSFTASGDIITGASGGLASGLSFLYTGSSTSSPITVSLSQGIGDAIYQLCQLFGNSSTGLVESVITTLQSEDTDYTTQKSALVTQSNTYYDELLTAYGNVEAQISTNNNTYKLLTELLSSSSSSG
jgi:flagellar hook-associated protein 2